MKTQHYVPRLGGDDYDYSQDHCYVKVASGDTGGELSMVEDELKPGFSLGEASPQGHDRGFLRP